jgi:glycosyltransferase involved in cell wall biosynthesis
MMRLAVLAPRLTVRGPLPKLTPVLVEALRRKGCEVEIFPWGRRVEGERLLAKVPGRLRDVMAARRAIVRGRFAIVVVHTAHDWLTLTRDLVLTRVLAKPGRVVILQFHGSQSPRLLAPGSRLFKWATAALLAAADGVLVLSREEQREWQRFSPGSVVLVIRNPLPEALLTQPPAELGDGEPTILCVSRLLEGKGVLDLVRALPVVQRRARCRLVFAGDGPEASRIRRLAEDLGVREHVELLGYVEGDELARTYRSADVFALPTALSEGFPMAIMEAMAAGLPIVTTPSRGQADYLIEDQNALFVRAGDHEDLAEKLVELVQGHDRRVEIGRANRLRAREFEPDAVAAEYLAALEQIVELASASR